jgi:molecular chaperone IbpA
MANMPMHGGYPKGPHDQYQYMKEQKPNYKSPAEVVAQLTNQLLNRGIGFNNHQLFFAELLNQVQTPPSYPPYDIVGEEENKYEIRIAAAGFAKDDIDITFQDQVLSVQGSKDDEDPASFFHKGIASRDFKLSFPLAEYVAVTSAIMKDGILTISLVRELPEELKPKTIKIK